MKGNVWTHALKVCMQTSNYFSVKTVQRNADCVLMKVHIALHVLLDYSIGTTHVCHLVLMDTMLHQVNA